MITSSFIVIGIPTFKREQGLHKLLESIQNIETNDNVTILVADNDGEQGVGIKIAKALSTSGYRFPILSIPVPERGISQVRNALMKKALYEMKADALVMVDDDERVEPAWLQEHVSVWKEFNFDIVGGAVYPEFESEPPAWVNGLNLYWRKIHARGPIKMVQGTGNVLISREVTLKYANQWFDHAFALTGGEDGEFFMRLKNLGATFGFAPNAVSHETFTRSRTTITWALQRAYRIGSGDARIFRLHLVKKMGMLAETTKLFGALFTGLCAVIVCLPFPRLRVRYATLISRQFGKLNGYFGKPPQVYQTIHGK